MPTSEIHTGWHSRLLERNADIQRLLGESRRIAVLGIKVPESYQPAYHVPRYMQLAGYEIVPVPVYYPDVTEILGERVYRKLADIPGELDIISVFRRPSDLPPHLDDILRARPAAVWMQSGIRHRAVAESLAREGIEVVQDRCMMVEHQKLLAAR
ncbi:MAG TPA: CoA-binding protein [Gemmatimonadales bacterium]|nr:CoA-binding protein [Gemmatimonadales bacterium]